MRPLATALRPCSSCPYRRDCPPGIWAPEEYEKLRDYDTNEALAVFLCHRSTATGVETLCQGWLSVHRESVAARLAVLRGYITDEERCREPAVPLYGSGAEAAEAGLAGVKRPGLAARRMVAGLLRKGIGRL